MIHQTNSTKEQPPPFNKADKRKASFISKGYSGKSLRLAYQGGGLSPTHYRTTPKLSPAGRSYTLRTQSLKGKMVTLDDTKLKEEAGGPFNWQPHNIIIRTRRGAAPGTQAQTGTTSKYLRHWP